MYPGAAMPFYEKEIYIEKIEDTETALEASYSECVSGKRNLSDFSASTDDTIMDGASDNLPSKRSCIEQTSSNTTDEIEALGEAELPAPPAINEIVSPEIPEDDKAADSVNVTFESSIEQQSAAKDVEPSPIVNAVPVIYPPATYSCIFKARSHNVMTRDAVQSTVIKTVPLFLKLTHKRPKVCRLGTRNFC